MTGAARKAPLCSFLASNPYPRGWTDGLFYRDKMRAIHRVSPDRVGMELLEIGGGRSGLSKLLYPGATVLNLDNDRSYADAACNCQPGQSFILADATSLPFSDESFDVVTMFDLLEHVPDDAGVAKEALRVLRPGGIVLLTTPSRERWRFPRHPILKPICPSENEIMRDWGHLRRGYDLHHLNALFGADAIMVEGFVNSYIAWSHDIGFSKLPRIFKILAHALMAPLSIYGWLKRKEIENSSEMAAIWQKVRV